MFFMQNGFVWFIYDLLVTFIIWQNHISSLDKMTPIRISSVHIDLLFLCKLTLLLRYCQKQVAGLLEKEQRHGVKLNIGWSCHAEFQRSRTGTIPCHDQNFSSRNGLLPESNVHPLSVTDLLQREDCCCYKREGLLKMKIEIYNTHTHTDIQVIRSGLAIFKRSQLLVVKILSAIQFKCKRATQLPSRAALSVHSSMLNSPEALCLLSVSESHLREQP